MGTTRTESRTTSMPPKEGIAIGTMTSEPLPVEVSTGMRARIVVAEVIRHGRILLCAAWIVAVLIFFIESGFVSLKCWVR